jgi:hypothetical protein
VAKVKDIVAITRKQSGWLLSLIFICVLGLAAFYFQHQGMTWKSRIGAIQNWLVFDPCQKRGDASPSSSSRRFNQEPSFDAVYANADGKLVAAGRGAPEWNIRLLNNGAVLGESKISPRGEWVLEPGEPLAPGSHTLSLIAVDADGQHSVPGRKIFLLPVAPRPAVAMHPARMRVIAGIPSAGMK